jgi:hypothetical protein
MGLLVSPETHRIDLENGEWVEVRKHMTNGDRAAVNSRAIIIRAEMGLDGTSSGLRSAQMNLDVGAWGLALLERMVVAWSDPEPVTPENVSRLSEATADYIREEIDRLNPARTEAEKKGSTGGSSPSSRPALATGEPQEPGPES